jgi:hypothetical protein
MVDGTCPNIFSVASLVILGLASSYPAVIRLVLIRVQWKSPNFEVGI